MAVRKVLALVALVVVLAGGAAALAGWLGWNGIHQPHRVRGPEQFVVIRQGAASGAIGRSLADAQIVSDARLSAPRSGGRAGTQSQGWRVRFDRAMTPLEVVDVLVRGDVYTRRITFPEGLTIEEMSKLYEEPASARTRLRPGGTQRRAHQRPRCRCDRSGGLPVSETYALPRDAPASSLIDAMVDRFRAVTARRCGARRDAGVDDAPAGHACIACGEGNRKAGRTSDCRRRLSQSAEDRDAHAGRPDHRTCWRRRTSATATSGAAIWPLIRAQHL